jgi:hypothetical protein
VTQVRTTSPHSRRRPSTISRWLAAATVAVSLVVPAAALGASPDLPRGIMGPTNESPTTGIGLADRTTTELSQRVYGPAAPSAGEGFSWSDAGIGAGAVAGLVALTGTAYVVRRRAHPSPRPAV